MLLKEIIQLEGKVIEERKDEKNMILDKENILASKEYRSAFFKSLQRKELNEAEKRAMTSASNSAGAAIPTQTANILVQKMFDVAPLLSEITLLRIAGNVTVATGLERDSAYQHTENANITASNEIYEYEDKIYSGACFTITFDRNTLLLTPSHP